MATMASMPSKPSNSDGPPLFFLSFPVVPVAPTGLAAFFLKNYRKTINIFRFSFGGLKICATFASKNNKYLPQNNLKL